MEKNSTPTINLGSVTLELVPHKVIGGNTLRFSLLLSHEGQSLLEFSGWRVVNRSIMAPASRGNRGQWYECAKVTPRFTEAITAALHAAEWPSQYPTVLFPQVGEGEETL